MNEPVSKMWAYMALILFLILSVFIFVMQFDRTIENAILEETMEFVNECQVTGKISPSNYNAFCKNVYSFGHFTINMEYKNALLFPVDGGSDTEVYYTGLGNQEILDNMFSTGGDPVPFKMKNGDQITVTVVRNGSATVNFMRAMFNTDLADTILVKYTGTVGNNNNFY